MSDASTQSLKVSREGIILIKSFEGFRPRAIRREQGGWIIGYGHTLSAREGATVSEGDAELLLRYDLLPVEKTLNETVPAGLNQHQFDALVSFAFSVGLDRFVDSDVSQRLSAGAPDEAAEAMMGWPEPVLPQSALRRRAAERALFTADPAAPVALSDLLAAPLPPPPLVSEPEHPIASTPAPVVQTESAPSSRSAAVAALLGEESEAGETGPSPLVTTPALSTVPSGEGPSEVEAAAPDTAQSIGQDAPAAEVRTDTPSRADTPPEPAQIDAPAPAPVALDPLALSVARYSPYGAAMVGPLPYLQPASPRLVQPEPQAEPDPEGVARPVAEGDRVPSVPVVDTPTDFADADEPAAPSVPDPSATVAEGLGPDIAAPPASELILTPTEDTPEPVLARALWSPEQRAEPMPAAETGLFGEDLSLTQGGGPILHYDNEPEPPVRFDWSETGAFIIMGAVGLTAFGASMAAFRLASEQSNGGSETTMIAWVLAVIGAACVGVSSFNLYRRWGLPGGD